MSALPGTEPTRLQPVSGPTGNIETAIAAVYGRVGYVQKEHNENLRYSFASEAEFIKTLRPALLAEGITVRAVEMRDIVHETIPTKNGTANRVTLIATFRFTHAPSESSIDVQAAGEGMDNGDKATAKAMTIALKYALRQTFLIETGDDPDSTSSDEYERKAAGGRRPAATASRKDSTPTGGSSTPVYPWQEPLRAELEKAGLKAAQLAIVFDGEVATTKRINEYLAEGHSVEQLVSRAADLHAARKT